MKEKVKGIEVIVFFSQDVRIIIQLMTVKIDANRLILKIAGNIFDKTEFTKKTISKSKIELKLIEMQD